MLREYNNIHLNNQVEGLEQSEKKTLIEEVVNAKKWIDSKFSWAKP